ncbi:JAB domain-containing protein [Thiohalocapsa marina]|uniref:JAB domain-containing protein n=1 Tax=Thiohalocapsa marina TaxID=424902 RepID=UPI0036D7E5A6
MRQSNLFQADPIRSDLFCFNSSRPGVLDAHAGDTTKVANRFAALAAADLSDGEQDSVIQLALQVLEPRVSYTVMTDATASQQYFRLRLAREPREIFLCAFLDTRHRLIDLVELFQGTLDGCSVHPRVVAQEALRRNAAACLFVHNHPSGDPTPSAADLAITKRLREVLTLFDIRVLDHLVVGRDGAVSLAEEGRI